MEISLLTEDWVNSGGSVGQKERKEDRKRQGYERDLIGNESAKVVFKHQPIQKVQPGQKKFNWFMGSSSRNSHSQLIQKNVQTVWGNKFYRFMTKVQPKTREALISYLDLNRKTFLSNLTSKFEKICWIKVVENWDICSTQLELDETDIIWKSYDQNTSYWSRSKNMI